MKLRKREAQNQLIQCEEVNTQDDDDDETMPLSPLQEDPAQIEAMLKQQVFKIFNREVPQDVFFHFMSYIAPVPHFFKLLRVCKCWKYLIELKLFNYLQELDLWPHTYNRVYIPESIQCLTFFLARFPNITSIKVPMTMLNITQNRDCLICKSIAKVLCKWKRLKEIHIFDSGPLYRQLYHAKLNELPSSIERVYFFALDLHVTQLLQPIPHVKYTIMFPYVARTEPIPEMPSNFIVQHVTSVRDKDEYINYYTHFKGKQYGNS